MANKVKISTKVKSFEDVQKSLQDIEKNFNKLLESVNKKSEVAAKETEGESGDIKSANEGTNAGNDYSFQVKTDKGWQSPILKPHFESDWEAISAGGKVKFTHDLGSKILLLQLYFKCDGTGTKVTGGATVNNKGDIFNLSHIGFQEIHNDDAGQNDKDAGIAIFMDENIISVGAANHYILYHDNTHSISGDSLVHENSGFIKVLAWKTGIIR
jgi:hypothetical protein